ncbi:MAG: flagellin lysine-N-methylase [Clostridia bacterium]|nr:flagellin lysine-N-methylase [Clostridia bacterium]
MYSIAPDYYPSFRCIADRCRHTCCRGWEIDIDAETLSYYNSVPGDIGARIRGSIVTCDGVSSFRLQGDDERCPFLNSTGLCDIITHLGEDALCQICDDHPRYYNDFDTFTQVGVGLACEAAADLILRRHQPAAFITLADDAAPTAPTDEEADFLRLMDALLSVITDRSMPLALREEKLLAMLGVSMQEPSPEESAALYGSLELLDSQWQAALQRLTSSSTLLTNEVMREQLLAYFIMRHLAAGFDDGDYAVPAAFAIHAGRLIASLARTEDEFVDIARMYSSEIEYSDENLPAVMDFVAAHLTDIN